MVQKKARPRNSKQCMKGSITIKQIQSAIDPFTAHLKRALHSKLNKSVVELLKG